MKSIYSINTDSELTRKRRKVARNGFMASYLRGLCWQFLALSIVCWIVVSLLFIDEYGFISKEFLAVQGMWLVGFWIAFMPLFNVLRGYFSQMARIFLSTFFTGLLIGSLFLLFIKIF